MHRPTRPASAAARIASMLLLGLPLAAAAQQYRCESNGVVSYQSQPCPGGKPVPAAPQPSAQDQRAAQQAARQDKLDAAQMERERLAREKASHAATGVGIVGPREAASAPVAKKKKKGESEYFTAQSPRAPKDKKPKKPKPPRKPPAAASPAAS